METISTEVRFFWDKHDNVPLLNGVAGSLVQLLDACLVNGYDARVINALQVSNGIVTAQIYGGHTYEPGAVIRIQGATAGQMNADWRIAETPDATTVRWSVEGLGVADGVVGGTITALRAPAGWEKLYSSTDGLRAAYRSLMHADHYGMVLYVDDTDPRVARVKGFTGMTDIDMGQEQFPSETQLAGGFFWAKSYATNANGIPFVLAADAKRFAFCPAFMQATSAYAELAPGYFFGRLSDAMPEDVYASVVTGATSSSNALNSNIAQNASCGGFVVQNALTSITVNSGAACPGAFDGVVGESFFAAPGMPSKGNTGGINIYATVGALDLLQGMTVTVMDGLLMVRGTLPSLRHLATHNQLAGGFSIVGQPGNGAVFVRTLNRTNGGFAFLLDLGQNGRWPQ